jgi:ferric-dicitrate binding protein FerR (iron transport regulator)
MPEQAGTSRADAAAAEAIDWLTRQRDPRFTDWEAFTAWLEADPANAARYDALAALDAGLAEDMAQDPPLRAPLPRTRAGAPAPPAGTGHRGCGCDRAAGPWGVPLAAGFDL